jgi:hypothetical protein
VECDTSGTFSVDDVTAALDAGHRTPALLAITGASNVTGWLPPLDAIIEAAHARGVPVLVDAAQLAPHRPMPVDADYLVFSGHKLYAPFGSGALIGPRTTFATGDPFLAGGGAVDLVGLDEVIWTTPPDRDEAGSPNVIGAVALHAAIVEGLEAAGLPASCVQMTPTADRAAVGMILAGLDGTIDLIIPRGGKSLVARVQEEARVAVLGHLEGLCHTYVHAGADEAKARAIVVNAKTQRPGVCNAAETLLVHEAVADAFLPRLAVSLAEVALVADERSHPMLLAAGHGNLSLADDEAFATEFLGLTLAVGVVDDLGSAIDHIARYSSGHSEAIVTSDVAAADRFVKEVDAAAVLVNASTRFIDGEELGLGAEIGISTQKLHARGPMGLTQLTTLKWIVTGNGQVRT